jgi:DNA-binding PadR family transcriptional regulator
MVAIILALVTMTEPSFFVLAALAGGPLHGYAIVGEVDELSASRVKLKIGSLYGVLDRLVAEGQVELDREEVHNGRLRRYYRITNGGVHALRAEATRQAANVRLANGRIRALQSRLGTAE